MLLVLDSTSRTLRAKMSDAPSSVQCSVTVTYADTTATTFVEGMYPIQLNGTTLVTILPAPASGTRRVVKSVMFFNDDTMTHTITLYLTDNITDYPITKISLPPGSSWASDDQTGVNVGGAVTDGSKGDISVSNGGDTWTIANSAVTLAKMADLPTDRLIGRDTAGTGVPEQISVTGGVEFTGSGSIQVGAFSGDVAKTAGSSSLTISNNAVTYAKMQDVTATARVIGRRTTGAGDPEECSLSQVLDFVGSAAQGDLLYRGASEWTRLGAGTSGQYLQTQGSGANPQWASVTGGGSAFKNRLINGAFVLDQRNSGSTTSIADDVYCFDRWYILSQTSTVQVVRQTNEANGIPINIRITQNQATAQRCGIAQIIESINCRDLRGQSVVLRFDMRCSSSQAIRYAILEWTGTADSVTSDIVNSWTNATFTTGQYFNSTSLTLVGTGSTTPSANTWTTATALTGTISSSANNLIVFIWSEGTLAQNATLDLAKVQLESGSTATAFEVLPIDVVINQCLRYLPAFTTSSGDNFFGSAFTTSIALTYIPFIVKPRVAPTGIVVTTGSSFDVFFMAAGSATNCTSVTFRAANLNVGLIDGNSAAAFPANIAGTVIFLRPTASPSTFYFTGCEL